MIAQFTCTKQDGSDSQLFIKGDTLGEFFDNLSDFIRGCPYDRDYTINLVTSEKIDVYA